MKQLIKGIRYNVVTKEMEEYEELLDIVNPRISEIQERLAEILVVLKNSDYKTIKFIEGDLSEEEFQAHKDFKNSLRAEYNDLEEELKTL